MARTGLRMMLTFPLPPLKLSGRTMALCGLRMMPRFPSPSLKFRTVSFPQSGFKAGISDAAFPVPGLPSPFVLSATIEYSPLCVGDRSTYKHLRASGSNRSTPGALAPVRVMLSRSINTYAAPSAPLAGTVRFHCSAAYTPCPRCAFPPRRPATGSELSLLILSQHVVLHDSGESSGCMHPVPSPPTLAFVPLAQTRHSQNSHKSASCGECISQLHYGSLALRPADLFTLLTDLTGFPSSHRGFLLPGFRRFGHPLRRRLLLQWQLGNFHRRDLRPLEWQLASLHAKARRISTIYGTTKVVP
jgi:hypothetical protein